MSPRIRSVAGVLIALAGLIVLATATVDALRWPSGQPPSAPPPVTLQALLEEGSQQRHTMYAMLRQELPGVRILMDQDDDRPRDDLYLRHLGRTGPVEFIAFPDGWLPERAPDLLGNLSMAEWTLHRAPGPTPALLLGYDGRNIRLVDARLVADRLVGVDLSEPMTPSEVPVPPGRGMAVAGETLLIVLMILLGGLLLPRTTFAGPIRPAVALLLGLAVQSLTAYLWPLGRIGLALPWLALLALAAWRRSRPSTQVPHGWRRQDFPGLVVAALVTAATVLVVRTSGLVFVTADSINMVARSIAMASGDLGPGDLDFKRPLALSAVEAPAHLIGLEGLHGLGLVLLIACGVIIALLPTLLVGVGASIESRILAGTFGALIVVSAMLRTMASMTNTHLLLGALLLVLAVLWAVDDDRVGPSAVSVAAAVVTLALIPTRAEAVLLVFPLLVATLLIRSRALPWRWMWPVAGWGLVAWNGFHLIEPALARMRPQVPPTVALLAGFALVLASPIVRRLTPKARWASGSLAIAALWMLALVGDRQRFFAGLAANIGQGEGNWGLVGPSVAIAAIIGLTIALLLRDDRSVLAACIAAIALPSILLAKALDGTEGLRTDSLTSALGRVFSVGATVGWRHSGNRMWTHFMLAMIALLIMTVAMLTDRTRPAAPKASRASTAAILSGGLAALLLVLSVWQPAYLGPVGPTSEIELAAAGPGVVGPELSDGVILERELVTERLPLPADAQDAALCVSATFVTDGRVARGDVILSVAGAAGQRSIDFGEFAWQGVRERTICIPLTVPRDDERDLERFTVRIEGRRGAPGSSAFVLVQQQGADDGWLARSTVSYYSPSEDERSFVRRVASVVLRSVVQVAPVLAAVLLAAGLGLSSRSSARSSSTGRDD